MQLAEITAPDGHKRRHAHRSNAWQIPQRSAADRELLDGFRGCGRRGSLDVVAQRNAQLRLDVGALRLCDQRPRQPDANPAREAWRRRQLARRGEQRARRAGRRRFGDGLVAERLLPDPQHTGAEFHTRRKSCRLRRRGPRAKEHDAGKYRDGPNDPHFFTTLSAISPLSPPFGTTTTRAKNITRKSRSTGTVPSKKLSTSASSSGSTRTI